MMESDLFRADTTRGRRKPRQRRSEKTVGRIMDVAMHLILKEGYTAVTTNQIAKEARVNISSLYQYFPNKHAIAFAIYEKAAADFAAMSYQAFMAEMAAPMEKGLRRVIQKNLEFVEQHQDVLVKLIHEAPQLRQPTIFMSIDNMAFKVTYMYMKRHLPDLDEATIRMRMYLGQRVSIALIYQYVQEPLSWISRKRFIDEVTRISISIIKGDSKHPVLN